MVRVSGTQAGAALSALAGSIPPPRRATRALLRDGQGEPIDDAVVLWFPGPGSATGEDVAEFHVHGGRAVLAALVAALSLLEQMRAAEPGEFTRRAFENGKLDLTEAEGLDDLIHADTDRQRRRALRQLKGMLGDKARDWRSRTFPTNCSRRRGARSWRCWAKFRKCSQPRARRSACAMD
jgi:tRNA modification GTPase